MELIQDVPGPAAYLAVGDAIDHGHPLVRETADRLRATTTGPYDYARTAFEFVRDTIPHSHDADDPRVTWRASDVLAQRTGICYAKSHALTALLRAEGIPAGLCYQRLADEDGGNPVIHGLIAVLLPGESRWARQDPRGNKPGVDAQFSTDGERLAWPVRPGAGETDYPTLYAAPPPSVLESLQRATDRSQLWRLLPTAL
ncbi:transglutaminase family protein [Streptomyces sp. H10-C2]|uniref:transglutaminase-like domain-containing protein n=1 Tax=unclassified Streptomyces TaxID=2593676 RepID=UPI0024BA4DF2|nr:MULTISPECIES: transglutaminase family protein [unclassified Streptomyces]MDJ0342926.1 transglutaminase family protein [Streptomyces sp. PH10-H1]MDJ0372700.1 transglutaminase family protein [Streptomyces sp. H10-C2]